MSSEKIIIVHQEYNSHLMAYVIISMLPRATEDSKIRLEANIQAINGDYMGTIIVECKKEDLAQSIKSKKFMAHIEEAYISGEFAVMQEEIGEGYASIH